MAEQESVFSLLLPSETPDFLNPPEGSFPILGSFVVSAAASFVGDTVMDLWLFNQGTPVREALPWALVVGTVVAGGHLVGRTVIRHRL